MNFLAPFAFIFAATLPVVIVFYMLKRRRTVRRPRGGTRRRG